MFSKKITQFFILLAIMAWGVPSFSYADSGFVYPFDKIATPACKWSPWSSLGDDCKITIPRIEKANYSAYKENTLYRRIYSVLWGATYDYGWDTGFGGHEGVDIATAEGTPVRAVADGEVVIAGWLNGWGNTVSIRHTLADGTKIWSNYAHLSSISVTKWQKISKLTTIGWVGNTGNSYGNHLHFQIDISGSFHPFYFSTCAKGLGIMATVNSTVCRSELLSNTVDPIAFIESGKLVTTITNTTVTQVKNSSTTQKIDKTTIKPRTEIIEEEMKEFLSHVNYSLGIPESGLGMQNWSAVVSSISFTNTTGKKQAVSGNLPDAGLEFSYDKTALRIFPDKIISLDGGKRTFTITTLKPGAFPIKLKMWSVTIAERTIYSLSKTDQAAPASMELRLPQTMTLGSDARMYVVPKTKYGTTMLDVSYGGTYVLRSKKPWVKFCNISTKEVKSCGWNEFTDEIYFTTWDTWRGMLDVLLRTSNTEPIEVEVVVKSTTWPVIGKAKRGIAVQMPKDVSEKSLYGESVISMLKKNLFPLYNKDYLSGNRNITGKDARDLVKRLLYLKGKNVVESTRKRAIVEKIRNIEAKFPSMTTANTVTRAEFAEMVLYANGDPLIDTKDTKFLDEKGAKKNVVSSMRILYDFHWKDAFRTNYFQPDKAITIEEALYLVDKVGKKE